MSKLINRAFICLFRIFYMYRMADRFHNTYIHEDYDDDIQFKWAWYYWQAYLYFTIRNPFSASVVILTEMSRVAKKFEKMPMQKANRRYGTYTGSQTAYGFLVYLRSGEWR